MPVFDWNNPVAGLDVVIDWGTAAEEAGTIEYLYLHARLTTTLYHAEGTTGESTPVAVDYNLVDESGNSIVDEAANPIIVPASESAILMHANETNTLYHAEG